MSILTKKKKKQQVERKARTRSSRGVFSGALRTRAPNRLQLKYMFGFAKHGTPAICLSATWFNALLFLLGLNHLGRLTAKAPPFSLTASPRSLLTCALCSAALSRGLWFRGVPCLARAVMSTSGWTAASACPSTVSASRMRCSGVQPCPGCLSVCCGLAGYLLSWPRPCTLLI